MPDRLMELMVALQRDPRMRDACEQALASAAEAIAGSGQVAPARPPEPIDMPRLVLTAAQSVTFFRALQAYGLTPALAIRLTEAYVQALVVQQHPVRLELPPEPEEPAAPWA